MKLSNVLIIVGLTLTIASYLFLSAYEKKLKEKMSENVSEEIINKFNELND